LAVEEGDDLGDGECHIGEGATLRRGEGFRNAARLALLATGLLINGIGSGKPKWSLLPSLQP
jgi:hypothetical protein